MAARTTKRTPKAARKSAPAGKLELLRKNALGAVDKIVKQGTRLQARGAKLAAAKAKEARAAVTEVREAVTARADAARARTLEAVSNLEKVFENRVQGAISKLGVPTARDVRALSRQVAQLQQSVDQLRRARARA
ncbi:MAG TPA: phasin family protein [Usitatibacter sp.]|nr:phasin family protein [Usitatibacter sp.]